MKLLFSLLITLLLVRYSFGQKADSVSRQSDSTQVNSKNFAFYPALGYSPETRGEFGGVAFFVFEDKIDDGIKRNSSLTPAFIYTLNKQIQAVIDADYYFKNGDNVFSTMRYFDFPDKYFGIGPETDADVEDTYTDRFFRLDGRYTRPQSKNLFLGVYYDIQFNNITKYDTDSLLATDSPRGIKGGRTIGFGPALQFDTRNDILYPTKGKLINVGFTAFSEAVGSEYNYQQYLIDYRQYFKFLGPKNILAFQFKSELTSGDDIPFYKLNRIAGNRRLRGIGHKNLYRDRQAMFFQVEGRQELFWRLGGVIWAGAGQVFDKFQNFNIENTRIVYGLGGRFQAIKGQKMNVRMDLGFSDEGGMAFYLSVREAF
ncbi:BamA/TamA family outer membrane protein [Reichenbachiella versicolor]|uniref:BamA/TamA family outer membrane protein n=1 Tax=Reichenbachiella versicolor TaxID=1821036 RepID=UPI000D6DE7E5|nr:BamA/TamA family outer membrane protein [Reichenbachiella versicolor]